MLEVARGSSLRGIDGDGEHITGEQPREIGRAPNVATSCRVSARLASCSRGDPLRANRTRGNAKFMACTEIGQPIETRYCEVGHSAGSERDA